MTHNRKKRPIVNDITYKYQTIITMELMTEYTTNDTR